MIYGWSFLHSTEIGRIQAVSVGRWLTVPPDSWNKQLAVRTCPRTITRSLSTKDTYRRLAWLRARRLLVAASSTIEIRGWSEGDWIEFTQSINSPSSLSEFRIERFNSSWKRRGEMIFVLLFLLFSGVIFNQNSGQTFTFSRHQSFRKIFPTFQSPSWLGPRQKYRELRDVRLDLRVFSAD